MRLGQGLEKARAFLVDNPDIGLEIEKALKSKLVLKAPSASGASAGGDDGDDEMRPTSAAPTPPGKATRL